MNWQCKMGSPTSREEAESRHTDSTGGQCLIQVDMKTLGGNDYC